MSVVFLQEVKSQFPPIINWQFEVFSAALFALLLVCMTTCWASHVTRSFLKENNENVTTFDKKFKKKFKKFKRTAKNHCQWFWQGLILMSFLWKCYRGIYDLNDVAGYVLEFLANWKHWLLTQVGWEQA